MFIIYYFAQPLIYFKHIVLGKSFGRQFIEESINMQRESASKIAMNFFVDVYLYDGSGLFDVAENHKFEGIDYKKIGGRYAVLNAATQKIFKNPKYYMRFVTNTNGIRITNKSVILNFEDTLVRHLAGCECEGIEAKYWFLTEMVKKFETMKTANTDMTTLTANNVNSIFEKFKLSDTTDRNK